MLPGRQRRACSPLIVLRGKSGHTEGDKKWMQSHYGWHLAFCLPGMPL